MKHISIALLFATSVVAQQPGHQKDNDHPVITTSECTASGCSTKNKLITMDGNWMWLHKDGTYTNCYTGDAWDKSDCPDPVACAKNCALDMAKGDYPTTYGATVSGDEIDLKFVTQTPQGGKNVGSRTYLMDSPTQYTMFALKNREFTFDVDVSTLPCGLNGALYFVEMDQDGGMAKYSGNAAGAQYGTGYCDAQCPHDIKMINGEANILNWTKSSTDPSSGTGAYGTCCTEMDIWESNSISQALTPHTCAVKGQTRCSGVECGDDAAGQRDLGVCDKDGCDLNPFRLGNTTFFGPGSNFVIDSTKKVTVITQFITDDGSDSGDLSEIRRKYVQDGVVIDSPNFTLGGNTYDSITDEFCAAQKSAFNDTDMFTKHGGLKAMGEALDRGVVLVMSLWDDHDVHMVWLDSNDPTDAPATTPGVARGTCAVTSGDPVDVEKNSPDATVKYSNIKVGTIGSTFTPSPSPAPGPTPPGPTPTGCPGGSLTACMALCPATPAAAYKACVDECVKRCT